MSLRLRYAARTDVGLAREGNEDALYAGPRLLAVADGMGGHAAGEVASRVVIETLAPLDTTSPDGDVESALRRAVQSANAYLRDMVAADRALEGMGTTLTAFLWTGDRLALVHIGDSRAYLLRDGQLQQVTHDHTFVQTLIDEGRITPDEAHTHPQRSWITNALDGRSDINLDVALRDVQVGDRYLVCSDGLSSYVSEETVAETLRDNDPDMACERLVELALRAGGLDNISVIVAEVIEDGGTIDIAAEAGGAAPIVAGAAAEPGPVPPPPVERKDSPASRAAAVSARHRRTSTPPPADSGYPRSGEIVPRQRRPRRLILVFALLLLIVIAGGVGTFLYVRTQYYVGIADGPPATVGVYRGVQGKLLGLDLDRLDARTNLPVQALPDYDRSRVDDGIQAGGKPDALRIVGTLRGDACALATPSPRPSPRPTPKATQKPTPKATPSATPKPTPTPTLPAYCQDVTP